jgi:OOP family OmpA-OmpF porin
MKTKAILIGTVAALALALPASAAGGWYVGIEGGGNWIDEADLRFDTIITPPGAPDTASFETGWAALGTVGYGWDAFRIELELGYRANDIDFFTGKRGSNVGEFNEFSQMLNVIYDWKFAERISLSVGAGAGGDNILYEEAFGHGFLIDDSDWVFAWQALAGVNYGLTSNMDLFVAYRYFNATEPQFTGLSLAGAPHDDTYDDVTKHTATVGLRYHFGQAPAPEPYVAPPPPPQAPVVPREFIVFFGHDKSNLTPEALDVVRQAAAAAKETGAATISVVGHADRSGSARYNDALSLRRANTVKGALAGEGIPDAAISVSAKGESDPLVPTADGVREPQNRRVNINM